VSRHARGLALLCLGLLVLGGQALAAGGTGSGPDWRRDEAQAFEVARREQRFVLLYLEAVWCHWCHVMDQQTYTEPAVQAALAEHYVALRIDHDARPDLAARYRDVGWPATIVFDAQGREIVKRQGYIGPAAMQRLLAAIVADPDPEQLAEEEPAPPPLSALPPALRDTLQQRHRRAVDAERGGLRTAQKFLDRDSVEYALTLGAAGDSTELARARTTLDAARALLDPAWGGVYQYSTGGDWQRPHYEKLAFLQAEYLRTYALAHAHTGDAADAAVVAQIRRYLDGFLAAPEGGWYTSQDADLRPGEHSAGYFALDDAGRRAQGLPKIDRQRYAREAGLIVEALAYWYEVSGDTGALRQALAGGEWLLAERRGADGGFRHDALDAGGPYLADNLAAGRGLLQLYRVTGERRWLAAAESAAAVLARLQGRSGLLSAAGGGPIGAVAQIDENIAAARFANLLGHYTGKDAYRALARHALAHLAREDVALSRLTEAGILLADAELGRDPLHLTIQGGKDDPAAQALFAAALRIPAAYKRLEWWDRREGPLPNPDIRYPALSRAAAFVCTAQRCSLPIHRGEDIAGFLAEQPAAAH
jgi:uncharacterized protein